ncbi:terminase gpP N-terminus-related DNA-binding protein [Clostridium sp. UBA4548]|uniref:terminase gpP N-terminus-related DNA-binding protein n=1 Tax=Clostridium sp. UBA4548 TaxID=1946361 RepID=UPI0025BB23FD|nr:endonuclease [Clostridium sp. UBA4548]
MKPYSCEVKNKAYDLYNQGLSAIAISKIIGANEATIRTWLRREQIDIRDGGYYNKKYPDEIINQIKKMYESGINTPNIDKILDLRRGAASELLRSIRYTLKHRGPKSMIEYEDYFDVIDTEAKAYFLGWIMADGNISVYNKQYSLKIHIALKDKEIINKFLKAINSTNKTKVKEGAHSSYYVSLTSIHMCKMLISHGVLPQKSGKEIYPGGIPEHLNKHFIRGVFDGDGITDIVGKRSGFVGSKNMLTSILQKLNKSEIKIIQNKKSNNIYYFLGGKKFSKYLFEFLYKDSTIWLERKKERLRKICSD